APCISCAERVPERLAHATPRLALQGNDRLFENAKGRKSENANRRGLNHKDRVPAKRVMDTKERQRRKGCWEPPGPFSDFFVFLVCPLCSWCAFGISRFRSFALSRPQTVGRSVAGRLRHAWAPRDGSLAGHRVRVSISGLGIAPGLLIYY